jgi:hypothetical protein
MTKSEAIEFFAEFFNGEHHFPSELKPFGEGWVISGILGDLGTYDFNQLTRFVIACHDKCIRGSVMSGGPNKLKLAIWKREREGDMTRRHPTMEQAIENYRASQKANPVTV